MELVRLIRVLRARWPIVALVAIVGFAAAFAFTRLANRTIDPLFEAAIPVRFDPEEGQSVEDLAEQVQDARDLAVLAAEPLLAENPGSSIFADTNGGRLVFQARGSSSQEAMDRAESLVEAYFETDPVIGGDVEQRLEDLRQRATEIESQIAELQPQLSPEERELVTDHDVLDRQIQRIEDEIINLTVADVGATEEERAQNIARRDQLRETLNELETEKALLPERPSEELSAEDRLRQAGLQRSLEILQLDYERLFLRTVGVSSSGRIEPAGLTDLTPSPANALLNGSVGLVLGVAIALFGLVGMARLRKEVWMAEDLPIPVLGEVPDRQTTSAPGPTWYDEAGGGQRKEAIQALRAAIEGVVDGQPTALALVADEVGSDSHHALAMDVAASFASAGRSVLVVDADYTTETDMTEFNVGEPSLGPVLRLPSSKSEQLAERIDALLEDCVHIRRDLAVMPAGVVPDSPADALAGPQFGLFISRAKAKFDLVLVIAGDARSATSTVVVQRAGRALLTVSPGKTTVPSTNAFVRDLRNLQIPPVGAVVVHSTRKIPFDLTGLPGWFRRKNGKPGAQDHGVDTSPLTRLTFYPSPEGGIPKRPGSASLHDLALELGEKEPHDDTQVSGSSDEPEPGLGLQVLEVIDDADPAAVYGPIAEYVVTRVEDILTASAGQTSLSPELIDVVVGRGFVTLIPVRGHRTAGDLLVSELVWELGFDEGHELAGRFEEILCEKEDYSDLDDWLAGEFFARHIERTNGEPEVWHLTSGRGTLQVLIYGRRLTRERLTQLNVDLVRRVIDEYERLLRKAHEEVDVASISSLEERLRELHSFEVTIGTLQAGSSDDARIVYPWRRSDRQPNGWAPVWAEGIRPNIAPLQRLGLLALPVLSNEELHSVELIG